MPSAVSKFLFAEVCSVHVHSELSAAANLLTASLLKQAVQRQVSLQFPVIVREAYSFPCEKLEYNSSLIPRSKNLSPQTVVLQLGGLELDS